MTSFREAAQKAGVTSPSISMQALVQATGLAPSISLSKLIGELAPEQVVFSTGKVTAGDVSGWADLAVFSNGDWSYRGHLHDSGTIFGDKYLFAIAFNHIDESGNVIGMKQDGELGAVVGGSRDADWQQNGKESWIAKNWSSIVSKGVTYTLKADPDPVQLLKALPELVITLGGIAFLIFAANNKKCVWAKDDQGNVLVTCPIE